MRRRRTGDPEETGLTVAAVKLLGERARPMTGSLTYHTACQMLGGTALVTDAEELVELAPPALPH